ncbi:hypothetical protein [Balneatrix alpica]|uniref:Uncharacterized protein n=1 Tax=Balneatrix alpica TaxID=75684 RepID=A0ABV5Z9I1_9GAMM|nr:hypothetical protein [Balneatrix alpica]
MRAEEEQDQAPAPSGLLDKLPLISLAVAALALLLPINLWLWVSSPANNDLELRVAMLEDELKRSVTFIAEEHKRWQSLLQEQHRQAEQNEALLSRLELELNTFANKQMLTLLIEQEQQQLSFLGALKMAAYELSSMIRGSRSWLDDYERKISEAEREAQARLARLKILQGAANKAAPKG